MEIDYLDLDDTGDLFEFYNREFDDMPYAYPLTRAEFEDGISLREDRDEPYADLSLQKIIVAKIEGEIAGFAHVALWQQKSELAVHLIARTGIDRLVAPLGILRFFHYRRGARRVGSALLREAENYLGQRGAHGIRAFSYYAYRFYRYTHGLVSDHMDHVLALLGRDGYSISYYKQLMHLPNFAFDRPTQPEAAIEVRPAPAQGRGALPDVNFNIHREGQTIGEAIALSGGHYSRSPMAQDTFYLSWIYLEEEFKGRGLGRFFLHSILWEMGEIGYRHSTLFAGGENFLAHLLYSNSGYRVVETDYMMFKKLKEPSD